MQQYKAVYFPDFPAESSNQKSVTIAFGKRTEALFETLKELSSAEMRQVLGTDSYLTLASAAQDEGLALNSYCLRKLQESVDAIRENAGQLSLFGLQPEQQIFDPLAVTFKGGALSPFVRWYPYLEGYSPQFVETIIDKYAPTARTILDPFAGSGTTLFTAARMGKRSYYCEVNPVLQFITDVKIRVRCQTVPQRIQTAQALAQLARRIASEVDESCSDHSLDSAYAEVFGDSRYFDDAEYDAMLKMRHVIDEIALTEPLLADLLTVAVLACLVPASRMKRAGDLRYTTPRELDSGTVSFIASVQQKLFEMSGDIRDDLDSFHNAPLFISESAQSLAAIPPIGLDAVITSPPYVNGTNYFRNTKIELWFLRCLMQKSDLSSFRAAALTAGINDVTAAGVSECTNSAVQAVVAELVENAYDTRIPRMVSSYFAELTKIFEAIAPHLNENAVLAIDIGDSAYAGVHVPADDLLVACLRDICFTLTDSVLLRQRRSRGGMSLRQSLLVCRYDPSPKIYAVERALGKARWEDGWAQFKSELPHQQQPFAKRNWGHKLHSVCSYMGKLKPSIAHHLVANFVPPSGSVLDPFAGVGTIPFEAAMQGKRSYSFDISPAALAIATAKLNPPTKEAVDPFLEQLQNYLAKNEPTESERQEAIEFGCNGKIVEYYETQTLREVLLARRFFQEHPTEGDATASFAFACMLHILHGNRPYALSRRSHPITPYKPSGDFEYKSLVEKLSEKVHRSLDESLPSDFTPGVVYQQDATGWWPREIDQLDAVITSPPFFDSTRFYLANWLRLWFAGWSSRDFDTQPLGFVDERQKKSFDVYASILRQSRERLKEGGMLVLHLGKSPKADMAAELLTLGKRWFRSYDLLDESVAHCETHGIRDKGTVTDHQYLLLY